MTEIEFLDVLGKPETGFVRRNDGELLGPGIPDS